MADEPDTSAENVEFLTESLPTEDVDEMVDEPDWDAWEADLKAAAEAFGGQS